MNQCRSFFGICLLLISAQACHTDESREAPQEFTGKEVTYPLVSASEFNIYGTVTLKERIDSTTTISISLNADGVQGSEKVKCPVHLHYGDVVVDAAEIAAQLQPVDSKTWKSETILKQLSDNSSMSYSDLKKMNACIKIHLSAFGEGKDVILSAGNIGSAASNPIPGGRSGISVCKSE